MNYTLLNPLHLLNKTTKLEETEDELKIITGDDTYATITFNNRLCKIEIENTEIVYNLYYDRVVLIPVIMIKKALNTIQRKISIKLYCQSLKS